jgi:hypothetical protein
MGIYMGLGEAGGVKCGWELADWCRGRSLRPQDTFGSVGVSRPILPSGRKGKANPFARG